MSVLGRPKYGKGYAKYIAIEHVTGKVLATGETEIECSRNAAPFWPTDALVAPYYITLSRHFR